MTSAKEFFDGFRLKRAVLYTTPLLFLFLMTFPFTRAFGVGRWSNGTVSAVSFIAIALIVHMHDWAWLNLADVREARRMRREKDRIEWLKVERDEGTRKKKEPVVLFSKTSDPRESFLATSRTSKCYDGVRAFTRYQEKGKRRRAREVQKEKRLERMDATLSSLPPPATGLVNGISIGEQGGR